MQKDVNGNFIVPSKERWLIKPVCWTRGHFWGTDQLRIARFCARCGSYQLSMGKNGAWISYRKWKRVTAIGRK